MPLPQLRVGAQATLALHNSSLHQPSSSTCVPRWHQLLSDSCAPLRTCAEVRQTPHPLRMARESREPPRAPNRPSTAPKLTSIPTRQVHSGLAQRPGVSHFEAQQCNLDDAECYNRWPTGWPSGDMSKDPASCTKIRDMEKGCAAWLHVRRFPPWRLPPPRSIVRGQLILGRGAGVPLHAPTSLCLTDGLDGLRRGGCRQGVRR